MGRTAKSGPQDNPSPKVQFIIDSHLVNGPASWWGGGAFLRHWPQKRSPLPAVFSLRPRGLKVGHKHSLAGSFCSLELYKVGL